MSAPHAPPDSTSDNHLQLPRIAHHILNRLLLPAHIPTSSTHAQLSCLIQLGEVDPPILDSPPVFARKVDDGALRVEEEEVLGRGDGEGGVGGLRARGDLAADRVQEVLRGHGDWVRLAFRIGIVVAAAAAESCGGKVDYGEVVCTREIQSQARRESRN